MNPIRRLFKLIRKSSKKIIDRIKDPTRDFKERVFILLTLVTDIVVILAVIGDLIYGESIVEILALCGTIVFVPIMTLIMVKLDKVRIAARIIVVMLTFVILPVVFYFGGGVEGGGVLWIIFSCLYIGLVLSGWWRAVMLGILTIETMGFYVDAYFHPEHVVQHSRDIFYMDSMVSIIIVGFVCCMMVWFEEWLFRAENKRAREEAEKVEEMIRSQNRFFSSMSHEIRTPINTILGLNEVILRQEDASDEIIKDAGNIQGAGRMLLTLINDILDFSKIEAGSMDIVPVDYSVGNLISEIVNMIWLKAQEKGLDFRVDVDPKVPSGLFGDEVRIKQVLINLLNNAVKYTNKGSVAMHMESETIGDNQVRLLISVTDTGIGIKQEALPYLFDAFKRVDQAKNRNIEGTGLGLCIVKQLVGLMGGEVSVNSVYTQGSTFTVSFVQNISNPEYVGDISISGSGETHLRQRYEHRFTAPEASILIVDDNEMNLEVEKKMLDGTKITVDTASGGRAALERTLRMHYDVILMDHLMPEMDGIECLTRIRSQIGGLNLDVPIIALTANAGSESRELYHVSGFDGYLVKPVSTKQLEEMLLRHIPKEKINEKASEELSGEAMNTASGYRRKIPVMITTSSVCDLPEAVCRQLRLDILPFSVHTAEGVFRDGIDLDCNELVRYMETHDTPTYSVTPPVEEYVEFFATELSKAHQVIYIAVTTSMSDDYSKACEAAKSFENVEVINSGFLSSSMGFLVMLAARLAQQNEPLEKIAREIREMRKKVHCSFVLADTEFMTRHNRISERTNMIMKTMWLRPSLEIRNNYTGIGHIYMGSRIPCYLRYIRHTLRTSMHADKELLFVTYVDIPEDGLKMIEEELKKRARSEQIIFQKASAAVSCNCGPGTFGLLFVDKGKTPYHLGSMIPHSQEDSESGKEERMTEEIETASGREQSTVSEEKLAWYETIPGINGQAALKNSGSEETLRFVLKVFYDSIPEHSREIEEYYNAENWENYMIKVHALKSSSRLIGAEELGEDAYKLEMAAKENDIDYISQNHGRVMQDYKEYRAFLEEICAGMSSGEAADKPVADSAFMESFFEMIGEAARAMDTGKMDEVFAEIADYTIPEQDAEIYRSLKEKYDSFDYEGMLSLLETRTVGENG
ncbi:MAG: DegV family EDD domain-containing protein [Lachnospiraceae bacterium]|nr:DegV family EDD domain-containing protein [Lachnospiraceae bacterium]